MTATVADVLTGRARWALAEADAAELLAVLPDASIDALVTDPPAGIGFMGREWDKDKGGREEWIAWLADIMREALRVLKPGAHALVWALPRTSHWTATALELAGFEVRDRLSHLFGTGFPKSLDVSKAIDATAKATRPVVGTHEVGTHEWTTEGRKRVARGEGGTYAVPLTAPATDLAKAWAGWGTALKPACEDWWLCRRPLDGSVARNVARHGTGGLNVDGCRIGMSKDVPASAGTIGNTIYGKGIGAASSGPIGSGFDANVGRWPANVALSHSPDCNGACAPDCAVAMLDAQGAAMGVHPAGSATDGRWGDRQFDATSYAHGGRGGRKGDAGGASRFFYTSKPSRDERDAECWDLPPRSAGEATARADGTDGLKSPRAGAGRTGGARNFHPTVKSIDLMRWLCRLVTPPNGVVLDCFMGSGSTGVAAAREGFRFVGVEREPDYLEIARRRIARAGQLDLLGYRPPPARKRRIEIVDVVGEVEP